MGRPDRAVGLFGDGCACSQAVLLAWAPEFGLDETEAARLAAPFAAGMRLGSTCGAVTGALMVIGMSTCSRDCVSREGRAGVVGPIGEFSARFEDRVGSLDCPVIIGRDLSDPVVFARAAKDGLFASICAPAVRVAAEILDELLAPANKEISADGVR